MASEATIATDESQRIADETRAIWRACTRWLGAHPPQSPRDALLELAETTDPAVRTDLYGSGPIIEEFEAEIATLLGTEAAVFVPSGTMAQQVALRIWSERKNSQTIAFHPTCHLEVHEQKGYQRIHGLHGRTVGNPHELITLDDLDQIREPIAALLLELPQREIGGHLPAWDDLRRQCDWAREHHIALHLDGARLWESAPYYQRSYAEIAGLFDSVYVSFYKKLGGLAGAALAGDGDLIARARIWIRRHGGNLVRLFPYVLSARLQLHRRLDRMAHYQERALAVGAALARVPGVRITPDPPQAAMMHIYLAGDAQVMQSEALAIAREDGVALFQGLDPSGVPGHSWFELSIGDNADSLADEEIEAYFRRVLQAGAANTV